MLYLGTTVASWILMTIASKAIYSRLKEEGYEKKEAMKMVAKQKGMSKSEVYKQLL